MKIVLIFNTQPLLIPSNSRADKNSNSSMFHLMFRAILADELIHNYCSRVRQSELLLLKGKNTIRRTVRAKQSTSNVGEHLAIRQCDDCSMKAKPKTTACLVKNVAYLFCALLHYTQFKLYYCKRQEFYIITNLSNIL